NGREPEPGVRRAVLAAPARQRHRELHQGGSAHPGANPHRPIVRRQARAAPGNERHRRHPDAVAGPGPDSFGSRTASMLHGPGPAAEKNSQTKQNSAAAVPWFTTSQGLLGKWNWKYATAISPESRKATGRVKRPIRSKAPPTTSSTPPIQG